MAVTKIQEGRVSLPEGVREALGLEEGETLYAEVVGGGVLLRRAPLSARERARVWDDVLSVIAMPKGDAPEDPDALEAAVAREVKEMRRSRSRRV